MLGVIMFALLMTTLWNSASASASTATATADKFHIDPNDPRFKAVAEEIDRRIMQGLEDIVSGLQQARGELRGLQQKVSTSATGSSSAADQKLQNSIARALDKVETVLHGHATFSGGVRGDGEGQATVVEQDNDKYVYSNEMLAENWVALSLGSSNSTVTTAAATLSPTYYT